MFFKQNLDKPLYKLYNADMKNSRLTFNSSTNFTLPIGVYCTLQADAAYHGFEKNGKPNINGFLNNLIPALSDYQENLFKELLKYNNGDAEIAKACARSIYNVYLSPFSFCDDGVVNVPFRISKARYDDFMTIHDDRLVFYDTDFTGYVRTLLSEYASKSFSQREYLYAYRMIVPLREAMEKGNVCRFYMNDRNVVFVPAFIEPSPVLPHNYIVGIDKNEEPQVIRLSEVQKITVLEDKIKATDKMCDLIYDRLEAIYEEEYRECLE